MHEAQRRDDLAISPREPTARLLEPVHDAGIYPVWLSHPVAGGVLLLVLEPAPAVEEPEDQLRRAGKLVQTAVIVDWEVVIRHADISGHHGGRPTVYPLPFTLEDGAAGDVVVVVVIPVRGRPGQVPSNKGTDDLIYVHGAILQEAVFASDEVAIQHDEFGRLLVEYLIEDLDRVDILLRSPLIPGILLALVRIWCEWRGTLERTYSRQNVDLRE